VKPNSLVRIDPATNKVVAVIRVGKGPAATAVSRRSVWVYNREDTSVSEIDPATGTVRHTTALAAAPPPADAFEGPVLAADSAGAWIIGTDQRGRSYLTRLFAGPRGKREYRLEQQPRAVAVGYGAVWVVARGARGSEVLRIDPSNGEIVHRAHFPSSVHIDSVTAGLGAVWVAASSSGVLYRIGRHSGRVTGRNDLVVKIAPPIVVFGFIWLDTSSSGGNTIVVNPRTLYIATELGCCSPTRGHDAVGYGSIWTFDSPTGTVERWSGLTHQGVRNIHVTSPPFYGGRCLTSIAAGAGGVWVTAASNLNFHC
jgi:YVTN family beta-propeller protein